MLIRYLPNQIAIIWETVSPGIAKALPPFTYESKMKMNNILKSLLNGRMQLWIAHHLVDNRIIGVILTTFTFDEVSEVRNLLIYSVNGDMEANVSHRILVEGMNTLKSYAKANGCHRVIAYSKVPSIIKISKLVGGKVEQMFIAWDLIGEEKTDEDLHQDSDGDRELVCVGRSKL